MSRVEEREQTDCVCSVGMKLTWDINDPKLPQGSPVEMRKVFLKGALAQRQQSMQDPPQFDRFQEWTDGYVRYIYTADDKNAQRHLSGWAMRNTNNHNCQILKKSCLGVVLCSRACSLPDGSRLQLRPAICDKARQKQQKKACPSCSAALELVPCRGHSGYPVTNFWRVDGKCIFFQAKGVHDHPKPESKSETEARRSSVKRRVTSPPFLSKRRLLDAQALGPALISCADPADRISFIDQNFQQHYPAFQSAEPYYNAHNALQDAPPTLQKASNPRLYMSRPGYEFQGYRNPPTYPVTSDLCDPRLGSVLASSSSSSTAPHSASFDCQSKSNWKELLKTGAPYSDHAHYYSAEYPCRYPTNGPGSPTPLQTIITTTTKVSYQPCPPSKPSGLPGVQGLTAVPPSSLEDASSYSAEVKVTDECGGVIKSLSFPPDPQTGRPDRDGPEYRFSCYSNSHPTSSYRYDDY